MKSLSRTILIAAALAATSPMLMGGCTTLDTINENEQAVRSAINISTLATIEQSTDRAATAAKILKAAKDAKQWIDFEGISAQEVVVRSRARIAQSDLELSQKAALSLLVDIAEAKIADAISQGRLDAEQTVTVNKLLDWIIQSATAYAA